jgi:hypothetical protein
MGALFSKAQETAESAVGQAQKLVTSSTKPAEVGVPPTNAPQMSAPNSVVLPNKKATIATAASTVGQPAIGGRRHTRRLKRSVIRRRRHRQKHTARKH